MLAANSGTGYPGCYGSCHGHHFKHFADPFLVTPSPGKKRLARKDSLRRATTSLRESQQRKVSWKFRSFLELRELELGISTVSYSFAVFLLGPAGCHAR